MGYPDSCVEDMCQWLLLHLNHGKYGEKVVVTEKNIWSDGPERELFGAYAWGGFIPYTTDTSPSPMTEGLVATKPLCSSCRKKHWGSYLYQISILEDVLLVKEAKKTGDIRCTHTGLFTSGRRWIELGLFKTWLINKAVLLLARLGADLDSLNRAYCDGGNPFYAIIKKPKKMKSILLCPSHNSAPMRGRH